MPGFRDARLDARTAVSTQGSIDFNPDHLAVTRYGAKRSLRAGLEAALRLDATGLMVDKLWAVTLGFGVVTPNTAQRAALEED
jgi:hypothetical protein